MPHPSTGCHTHTAALAAFFSLVLNELASSSIPFLLTETCPVAVIMWLEVPYSNNRNKSLCVNEIARKYLYRYIVSSSPLESGFFFFFFFSQHHTVITRVIATVKPPPPRPPEKKKEESSLDPSLRIAFARA